MGLRMQYGAVSDSAKDRATGKLRVEGLKLGKQFLYNLLVYLVTW